MTSVLSADKTPHTNKVKRFIDTASLRVIYYWPYDRSMHGLLNYYGFETIIIPS